MRNFILTIGIVCISLNTTPQEVYKGTRKNIRTNDVDSVFYINSISASRNIFYNHFSIFQELRGGNPDTIYLVNFVFDRTYNTISISQHDMTTSRHDTKTIKFQPPPNSMKSPAKPTYCVNNYFFNDTLLNMNVENATILFTIDDTIKPMIFLHQFISIDGENSFVLDPLWKTYLTAHLSNARDYWEWYKTNSIEQAETEKIRLRDSILLAQKKFDLLKLTSKVDKEIALINIDKDSIWAALNTKLMTIKLSDTTANSILQQAFTRKMDDVFSEYFSNSANINSNSTGNYKIYVNTDKSKRIVKKQYPEIVPSCFYEQFNNIDKLIEHLPLENEEVPLCNKSPAEIIRKNHSARIEQLRNEAKNLNYPLDSVFLPILNSVDLEFQKVSNEKTKMATIYNYTYNVASWTEQRTWVLRGKKITDSHDTLTLSQDNLTLFYNKVERPKKGKYDVSLSNTMINDKSYGPYLNSAKLNYKFMTHFGFSIGAYIVDSYETTNNNSRYNFDLRVWNIYLIYHHVGVFAGSIYNQENLYETNFKNYGEGGIYLGGQYFYLKFGLARYKDGEYADVIKPLIGASLVFPGFHIEGGYNFVLKHPYIMAGFNIPINM